MLRHVLVQENMTLVLGQIRIGTELYKSASLPILSIDTTAPLLVGSEVLADQLYVLVYGQGDVRVDVVG